MTRLSALLLTAASLSPAWAQTIPLNNWNAPATYRLPSQQPNGGPRTHTDAAISTGLLTFVAITPCRVVDTRPAQGFPAPFGPPSLAAGSTRTVPIPSSACGIPKAAAYSLNFTAVVPSGGVLGFITAYNDDGSQPLVSTLNAPNGGIVANAAVVPAGASDGGINVFASNATDLVIDANGYYLDQIDSTGTNNTAVGIGALTSVNGAGNNNVSLGFFALHADTSGSNNVGIGSFSLANVTTGSFNLGFGYSTLANATGSRNVGIGNSAGNALTSGSDNLYFSNHGVSSDNGVIRIGTDTFQTSAYIAGVYNVAVSGQSVMIDSSGKLGTTPSSRRYKDDIQDMSDSSDNLMRLRPVTFRYKQAAANGMKPLQYGLIAEEVQQLYPDAVDYNAAGQVESVQYNKINAMLLNEVQKQQRTLQSQTDEIQALKDRLSKLESLLQPR